MIKSGKYYEDIYNYRNSKYFAQTVKNVRKEEKNKDLVILQELVKATMKH